MLDTRRVGPHEIVPFRPERNATIDTLRWAKKRLAVTTLLEVDVTEARQAVRDYRRETGKGLSFTAWIVSCVARAAAEHPRVHAVRRGGRELVLFHEVDVAVVVERAVGTEARPESVPMPYVVRKANEKHPTEIHEEIRRAQRADVRPGTASIGSGALARFQPLFFRLPAWLRDLLFWRWFLRNPARIKRTMGTIVVTAPGMTVPGLLTWGIPLSLHPLAIGVGGIARRILAGETREALALSIVFDHAVTDGAPVGRFTHRLHELITRAEGLADPERGDAGREER